MPELNATLKPEDLLAIRNASSIERPELAHNLSLHPRSGVRAGDRRGRRAMPRSRDGWRAEAFQLFLAERHKVSFFDDALEILERLARRHRLGALDERQR